MGRSDGSHFGAEVDVSECAPSAPWLTICYRKLKNAKLQGNGRVTKWENLGFLDYHVKVCPPKTCLRLLYNQEINLRLVKTLKADVCWYS